MIRESLHHFPGPAGRLLPADQRRGGRHPAGRALPADRQCGGRCPPCDARSSCCPPTTRNLRWLATIIPKFRAMAVSCVCMLAIGGCVHATKAQFMQHYALGGSASVIDSDHRASAPSPETLQVPSIAVPSWLAGAAMYYRLDYRDDRRLAAYGHSDWIAPPATLLEPIVQDTIAASGAWRAVIGPRNPANADASLHLRLDDFTQAFSQPHDSAGVLDATATLVDHRDGRVIAQRHFHVEVVAPTPDAAGGAKALEEASRQFAADLQRWLQTVAAEPRQPRNGTAE